MSRSTKKPYWTDQNSSKPKRGLDKRKANRAVRAENKKAIKGTESSELAKGASFKRVSDSWDIRDWSFYKPKDKRAYRK